MKRLIYIMAFTLILPLLSCQSNNTDVEQLTYQNELSTNTTSDSLWEKISVEELPHNIKEVIHNDDLFEGLNISNIARITENDLTYYDMTFKDVDGQLIMVFYDEEGEIIVP
jgi:hypothetical protein